MTPSRELCQYIAEDHVTATPETVLGVFLEFGRSVQQSLSNLETARAKAAMAERAAVRKAEADAKKKKKDAPPLEETTKVDEQSEDSQLAENMAQVSVDTETLAFDI